MTPSDRNGPGQEQGNPFDTGLPMVRMPAKPQSKRRRNARRSGRPRPTPNFVVGEEEWQRWLDPAPASAQPPPVSPDRGRLRARDQAAEPDRPETSRLIPAIIDRTGGNPGIGVRRPTRRPDEPRGNRTLAVLIVIALVIAVVSVVSFVLNGSGERARQPTTAPSTADTRPPATTAPAVQEIATPGCIQQNTPDVVSGTEPGGTTDGPSAILAFERAYYVQRSGFAARAVVAPDATVPPADQIQRGINQVPLGTRYCVSITHADTTPDGQARWKVELTQQPPGTLPHTFTQLITTRTAANRTLITSIASA